ncbi:DUF3050 domain-containing protein [Polaribacter sp. HL-MS24]|uniref:DUF3050 domain-containing protein n=1 Tax=Polaribacter sp. HL-MS24 TaxID=3077735 RepID=UPI002934AE57|nr:DUF3050 domain-containing protein [Polaribacter sp. HL-MS24]WOC40815.1 DUF3050 domain-containing protein [Polaribacter sp. HL-MS24]
MNPNIDFIENEIAPLRAQLKNHSLYKNLQSLHDVRLFMENHVFAVWDFMSLLKALQIELTTVTTPWVPRKNAVLARFINEITVAEESDFDKDGVVKSHFEMYLDAMREIGADTSKINAFIKQIELEASVENCLEKTSIHTTVKDFVSYTFQIVDSKETHKIASAFTFGREDVIPDMFLKIVAEATSEQHIGFESFTYYLNRHIELDGDEHGPLSLQMVTELCGNDAQKWAEVLEVAKKSLEVRIQLWSGIEEELKRFKQELV